LSSLGLLFYAGFVFVIAAVVSGCGGAPANPSDDGEGLARLELSTDSILDLGEILVNIESVQTLTIENQSLQVIAGNFRITEGFVMPFTFTGGVYPGSGGTCQDTLAPGASCTLVISAIPSAVGPITESLTIGYNDGLQEQTLALNFTATAYAPQPALLTFADGPLFDFGSQAIGSVNPKLLTVTNSGDLDATGVTAPSLTAPFTYAGGSFPGTNGTCSDVIAPGSCTIAIEFAPDTTDVTSTSLSLTYEDGESPQSTRLDITGSGRIAASIAILEGLIFDHGILLAGQTRDQTLTLQNNGGEPATAISISGFSGDFSQVGGSCGTTLNPGETCTILTRYRASGTAASSVAPQISYNDSFLVQNITVNISAQSFGNALTLTRTAPASSPGVTATPTLQVGGLISGLTIRLYANSDCSLIVDTENASGVSQDFTATVTEGSHIFRARAEDDYGNQTACSVASATYSYDNTNPNPVTNLVLSQSYTTNATVTPTWSWTDSSSSDRASYELGLSTSPAGGNDFVGWVNKGLVTTATLTGLNLPECTVYYPSVRVIDEAGLISPIAIGNPQIQYDSAVPTTPTNPVTGGDATDTNSATVTWTASSDNCGIGSYEIAIGKDVNGNSSLDAEEIGNVMAFKDIGLTTTHRENGLALDAAVNYYTSIRAKDTNGRLSGQVHSPPYIIYNPSIELPDMILWLDAQDPTTIRDGLGNDANSALFMGSVATWQDKSGSPVDHDFSTSSGAVDALFDGTAYSLLFNGSDTGMTTPNHDEINTATVTQRNLTVAFRTSSDVTSRQLLYDEGGSIRGMNIYIANGLLYCGFYNTPEDGDGPQPFVSVNRAITANTTYFVTWVFDYTNYTAPNGPDGSLNCYVDSSLIGSETTTSRLFAHSGRVGLGHINNQTCFEDSNCPADGSEFLGEIYELMLFNNAPDAPAIDKVHTYLNNKWR